MYKLVGQSASSLLGEPGRRGRSLRQSVKNMADETVKIWGKVSHCCKVLSQRRIVHFEVLIGAETLFCFVLQCVLETVLLCAKWLSIYTFVALKPPVSSQNGTDLIDQITVDGNLS